DLTSEQRHEVRLHVPNGRLKDQVAGERQSAKKEYGLRIGVHHGVGELHTQDATSIFKSGQRHIVATDSAFCNHLCVQVVEADAAQLAGFQVIGEELVNGPFDSGSRDVRFQAAAFPAIAISSGRIN